MRRNAVYRVACLEFYGVYCENTPGCVKYTCTGSDCFKKPGRQKRLEIVIVLSRKTPRLYVCDVFYAHTAIFWRL